MRLWFAVILGVGALLPACRKSAAPPTEKVGPPTLSIIVGCPGHAFGWTFTKVPTALKVIDPDGNVVVQCHDCNSIGRHGPRWDAPCPTPNWYTRSGVYRFELEQDSATHSWSFETTPELSSLSLSITTQDGDGPKADFRLVN
jgi:hypothetical protein